jgi:hypothetical protein
MATDARPAPTPPVIEEIQKKSDAPMIDMRDAFA